MKCILYKASSALQFEVLFEATLLILGYSWTYRSVLSESGFSASRCIVWRLGNIACIAIIVLSWFASCSCAKWKKEICMPSTILLQELRLRWEPQNIATSMKRVQAIHISLKKAL
eukprot:2365449-Amphidinium_carterae.1